MVHYRYTKKWHIMDDGCAQGPHLQGPEGPDPLVVLMRRADVCVRVRVRVK